MLSELHIRDFAIIDDLHLTFAPGFTVLTGETGAGKSIIIDSLELVLGGRAETTSVRSGADRAIVEATFELEAGQRAALDPVLEREGLDGDAPDLLLLGREVRANGRNLCRINGRTVTRTLLRQVAEGLVDIHGQSEHLSLLRVREHINLLDRYAGLWSLRKQVSEMAGKVRSVRQELADLLRSEQELAHRADLLQFQIGEVQAASLEPGEEEKLLDERLRLTNAEQLVELVAQVLSALEQGDEQTPPALDLLGTTLRTFKELVRIDPSLEPQLRSAESLNYQAEELVEGLRDYQEQLEHNPRRLQEVEERLTLIHRLERKYGASIPDVLNYARQAAQELDRITHSEERITELRAREEQLLAELGSLAAELSHRRRQAAQSLSAGIETELHALRMEGARFGVDFQWRDDPRGAPLPQSLEIGEGKRVSFNDTGIDRVEFLVSPNPGEPLKPLAKIASGGETSRLMLALKTVLSQADETPTLVFDEIDQGIGGRVGATVGEKLWSLTSGGGEGDLRHQVLCVTHLPQLAAFGDTHLHVEKHIAGERTVTRVKELQNRERVDELAQMLGGGGEAVQRSAEEILEQAAKGKGARERDG